MNRIRGRLDPQAFFDLYNSLSSAYADDVLQEAFGFAEETDFKQADRADRQAAPRPAFAEEVQGGGRRDQDHRRPVEAAERDVHASMATRCRSATWYSIMAASARCGCRIEGKTMNALDVIGTMCIDRPARSTTSSAA